MEIDLAKLPQTLAAHRQIIAAQAAELATAKAGLATKALEIEKLKIQIARLRRQQFGQSSEKIPARDRAARADAGGPRGGSPGAAAC